MQNTSVIIADETLSIWILADIQDNLEDPAFNERFDENTVIQFLNQGADLHRKLDKLILVITVV